MQPQQWGRVSAGRLGEGSGHSCPSGTAALGHERRGINSARAKQCGRGLPACGDVCLNHEGCEILTRRWPGWEREGWIAGYEACCLWCRLKPPCSGNLLLLFLL